MKEIKYVWEIWSKQAPKSLYYYTKEEVRLAKIRYQECNHTKVYIKMYKRGKIKWNIQSVKS